MKKQNKPQTEAPIAEPVAAEPSAPAPDLSGALDVPTGDEQPALPPAEPTDGGEEQGQLAENQLDMMVRNVIKKLKS